MRMRRLPALALTSLAISFAVHRTSAQTPGDGVAPATYTDPSSAADWSLKRPVQTASPLGQPDQVDMVREIARRRGGQTEALAQIIQLAREFDDATAAELIEELADAHAHAGHLNLAAETRRVLVERFPNGPLGRESTLWLIRLYASSEVAHARRAESQGAADLKRQLSPAMAAALKAAPAADAKTDQMAAGSAGAPADPLASYALHLAAQAIGSHAAFAEDPALAFQRSVAARRAGQTKAAQAYLSPIRHRRAGDLWGDRARAESWLEERSQDEPPSPVAHCLVATRPPRLDGRLNELFWQAAAVMPLREAPAAEASGKALPRPSPASVRLACDSEYLYIAAECAKITGVDYKHDDRPRPRDGDVEGHDRVRLRIDVDRDYASWFELVIDSRGWTADRCWGDPGWNPEWFVAADQGAADGHTWTIEAAIPRSELTNVAPRPGQAWACAVDRIAPGAAGQSWAASPSADTSGPEAFGLVLFE